MASAVNGYLIDKIRVLKSNSPVQEASLDVLDNFLSTKSVPAEGFEVKEVRDHVAWTGYVDIVLN